MLWSLMCIGLLDGGILFNRSRSSARHLFSDEISMFIFKALTFSSTIKLIAVDSVLVSFSPLLNNVLWGYSMLKNMAVYGITSTTVRWLTIVFFSSKRIWTKWHNNRVDSWRYFFLLRAQHYNFKNC